MVCLPYKFFQWSIFNKPLNSAPIFIKHCLQMLQTRIVYKLGWQHHSFISFSLWSMLFILSLWGSQIYAKIYYQIPISWANSGAQYPENTSVAACHPQSFHASQLSRSYVNVNPQKQPRECTRKPPFQTLIFKFSCEREPRRRSHTLPHSALPLGTSWIHLWKPHV